MAKVTAAAAQRLARLNATPLSRLGIGTYRLTESNPEHKRALARGLELGATVVDTSPNYSDGGAERLVGSVLKESGIDRDKVHLISKCAYQAVGSDSARHGGTSREPPVEGVEVMPGVFHSIHSDFIREQLRESLSRLGVTHLDTYLLHNPEHYLIANIPTHGLEGHRADGAEAGNAPLDANLIAKHREILYERLRRAFETLEAEVASGRIRAYGISSNNLRVGDGTSLHPHSLCLKRISNLADEVAGGMGGDGAFSVLEVPFNVLERSSLDENEGGCGRLATELGLSVITNRALTAFGGPDGQATYKLCDYRPEPEHLGGGGPGLGGLPQSSGMEPTFGTSLRASRSYEQVLKDTINYFTPDFLEHGEGQDLDQHIAALPDDLRDTAEACAFILAVVKDLDKDLKVYTSVWHYEQHLAGTVLPLLAERLGEMDETSSDALQTFFKAYGQKVRRDAAEAARKVVREREADLQQGQVLEDYALSWVLARDEISCTLLGMTKEAHGSMAVRLARKVGEM